MGDIMYGWAVHGVKIDDVEPAVVVEPVVTEPVKPGRLYIIHSLCVCVFEHVFALGSIML